MQQAVTKEVMLPAGYSIPWSDQFEYLERAAQSDVIMLDVIGAIYRHSSTLMNLNGGMDDFLMPR